MLDCGHWICSQTAFVTLESSDTWRAMAATLNGAEGKHLCLWERLLIKTLWIRSVGKEGLIALSHKW